MHIMEPVDLFDKYLDKKFRDRVVLPVDSKGQFKRGMIVIDGQATSFDHEMQQYRDSHAPYLSLTPKEYFQRNCWAAVEGSEPEIEATAGLIGADRMCISTDYPHFDSNFPNVANNLLNNVTRETAAAIFMGGAGLWNFDEDLSRKRLKP